MLRPGNAGANTIVDHVTVLDEAIGQLPGEIAVGHRRGDDPNLVRRTVQVCTDSAGCTDFVKRCRKRNVGFAVIARTNTQVHAAISKAISDEGRWQQACSLGYVLFGIGWAAPRAQVSNVVVAGIAGCRTSIANATNSIARLIGSMIAASRIASLLVVTSVHTAVDRVSGSSTLTEATRHHVVAQLRTGGLSLELSPGLSARRRQR